jgi:hypothetical protein
MTGVKADFRPFAERMAAQRLPDTVIRTFQHYYEQLARGETGLIPEAGIRPVESLPDLEQLPESLADGGRVALSRAVLLKLNGGLGTGMGLEKAKSLLTVRDGLTFLDIIARQATHVHVPLVLMNSFATREDSLSTLQKHPELQGNIPLDFLQHLLLAQPDVNYAYVVTVLQKYRCHVADPEVVLFLKRDKNDRSLLHLSSLLETRAGPAAKQCFIGRGKRRFSQCVPRRPAFERDRYLIFPTI